jgi:hypothetical protein
LSPPISHPGSASFAFACCFPFLFSFSHPSRGRTLSAFPQRTLKSRITRCGCTCRRLARLTDAFSKMLENFQAAVVLNFAYYIFVMTHGALRLTPAMVARIETSHWTVEELVKYCGE